MLNVLISSNLKIKRNPNHALDESMNELKVVRMINLMTLLLSMRSFAKENGLSALVSTI